LAVGCHTVLRGRWCDIFPNAHAPTDDKSQDSKDSLYEKSTDLQKYHIKILSGDFNAELGTEDYL
jgi:hypothetical protein